MTTEERIEIGTNFHDLDALLDYYADNDDILTSSDKKGISRAFLSANKQYTADQLKRAKHKHPYFKKQILERSKARFDKKKREVEIFAYNKNKRIDDFDAGLFIEGINEGKSAEEIAKRLRRPLLSAYKLIKVWKSIEAEGAERERIFREKVVTDKSFSLRSDLVDKEDK